MSTDVNETWDVAGNLLEREETAHVDLPEPSESRIAALEAKLQAVEALATKADVTAQEVAAAAKNARL